MDLFPLSIESTSALQGYPVGHNILLTYISHQHTKWCSAYRMSFDIHTMNINCVDWHCVDQDTSMHVFLNWYTVSLSTSTSRHYMSICCCVTVSNCYRRKLCFYREQLLLKGETCPNEIHTFPLIHTFIKSKYLQHIQRFIVNL